MTEELEKAYQRKLDNLGKRYDELRAKLVKYELGEDLPDAGAVSLLKKAVFHLGSAMSYYRDQSRKLHDVKQIKIAISQFEACRECRNIYTFIINMAEKAEVQS